jgi:hypothetical protein
VRVQTAGAKGTYPFQAFDPIVRWHILLAPALLGPLLQTKGPRLDDTHWLDLTKLLPFLASLAHGAIEHSSGLQVSKSPWLGFSACLTRLRLDLKRETVSVHPASPPCPWQSSRVPNAQRKAPATSFAPAVSNHRGKRSFPCRSLFRVHAARSIAFDGIGVLMHTYTLSNRRRRANERRAIFS